MLLEVAIYCFVKPKIIFWSMHHFFRFVCFFVEITMRAQCGCDFFILFCGFTFENQFFIEILICKS